jgi:hypothetical protein
MATSDILADLESLLTTPEEKLALSILRKNTAANDLVGEGLAYRSAYFSEPPAVTPPAIATPPAAVVTPPAAASGDTAAILKQLTDLNTSLETRFKQLDEKYVPVSKLPEMSGQLLERAIRNSHQAMRIELKHTQEFPSEPFELEKVNAFLNDAKAAGRTYPDLMSAYDDMVKEKRVEAKIKKGIEEGLKQKKSAETVPAQSGATALSPAQEAMRKARGDGAGNNLTDISDKLRKIKEQREASAGGTAEEAV